MYSLPVCKRGPKKSHQGRKAKIWRNLKPKSQGPVNDGIQSPVDHQQSSTSLGHVSSHDHISELRFQTEGRGDRIPLPVLAEILTIYGTRMYPVWPIVDIKVLLKNLESTQSDDSPTYGLAIALCAATMIQLNLSGFRAARDGTLVGHQFMREECDRQGHTDIIGTNAGIESVLTSFFLHVYHAKLDDRLRAMTYLQEAIYLARIQRLDCQSGFGNSPKDLDMPHGPAIFLLLWISER